MTNDLVGVAGIVVFIALGAAVWFGFWRSWSDSLGPLRFMLVGAPWMAAFCLVGLALGAIRFVGVELPQSVRIAPLAACLLIGFSVMFLGRPRWAIPRWYRDANRDEPDVVS